MKAERWQDIKKLFDQIVVLDPLRHSSFLDAHCAGDLELRREVESLLESHQQASESFLKTPTGGFVGAAVTAPALYRRCGAYQIVEEIGHGGMGEVFRAVRVDGQFDKDVAIKLVRGGFESRWIAERFLNERQILASLDHPNIARLLDGGTTDDGIPFLVMELIDGVPITEYCNRNNLDISERLQLFLQACSAVQYAHQRLVIHRDIKPANMLVTTDGNLKLLDFGIAKMLDMGSGASGATLTAFRVLTPRYASPEQIQGSAMTTGSDVYSMGVVLYEVLTGVSPYRTNSGAPAEIANAVCNTDPLLASLSVGKKQGKRFRGDLDNILAMALRKEPSRRYASAEQFAGDIRRNLAALPVLAQKNTASYRLSRFVARHRIAVTMGAALVVSLVTGLALTLREMRLENQRFNDVRALANSLIFDVHDSVKDLPGSTPARKIIVDRAVKYLDVLATESGGDIGLQRELAAAFERLGSVQGDYLENNLGDAEGTLASYKKALEIRQRIDRRSGDWNDRLALAAAYRLVAHQHWANGNTREARDTIPHAITLATDLSRFDPNNVKVLYELSFDHQVSGTIGYPGNPQERQKQAEDYKRALAIAEMLVALKPNDIPTIYNYTVDLSNLGKVQETFDPQAALVNYTKSLAMDQRLTTLSNEIKYRRSIGIDYLTISSVYDDLGDYAHAAESSKKDLEVQMEVVGNDPKNVLLQRSLAIAYLNTAAIDSRAGNIREALEYLSKGFEIMRPLIASAPEKGYLRRTYADALVVRGTVLLAAKQVPQAIGAFEDARSTFQLLSGPNSSAYQAHVAACDVKLGEAYFEAGQDRDAEIHFHQALEKAFPLIESETPSLDALYAAADAYAGLGSVSFQKAKRSVHAADQKQNWSDAHSWYERSLSTWQRIAHPNHIAPNGFPAGDPVKVKKQLELTKKAFASLH